MADLEVGDPELNSKNFQRIKADVKGLVAKQDDVQKSIDGINAEIVSKGPSVTLEGRLERMIEQQHSVCTRANLAISVIGLSIEDLTESSRDPPSVIAIKDLLESLDTFTDEISIKILRKALGIIQNANPSSCTDILEDLEKAFESLSKDCIFRSTKILQTTQLAVRDLATDPSNRYLARQSRYGYNSSSVSPSPLLRSIPDIDQLQASLHRSENYQSPQDLDDMLDEQDLHRNIGTLLKKFSAERIIEAVQELDDGVAFTPTISDTRMPQQKRNMARRLLGDVSWEVIEHRAVRELSVALQEKTQEVIDDWSRALENRMQVKDIHEGGVKVKEEKSSLQTKMSPHSIKRPSPALGNETEIKRSRSRYQ